MNAEQVRRILEKHWLYGIHCHHAVSPDDVTYDQASCACTEVALERKPTVGEAVGTWIDHVMSFLVADGQSNNEFESAAGWLTVQADKLRDEAPEAMGVAWDVVTDWIQGLKLLEARDANKVPPAASYVKCDLCSARAYFIQFGQARCLQHRL